MYLPSLGLCIIFGWLLIKFYQAQKTAALAVLLFVTFAYSAVIIKRNETWLSPEVFYQTMAATAPNSFRGYLNLAIIDYNRRDIPASLKNLEIAYNIDKNHPRILILMGRIALHDRDLELAEKLFLKAVRLRPEYPEGNKMYAYTLAIQGRYAESMAWVYAQRNSDDPQIRALMALNLYKLGRIDEAKQYFDWRDDLTEPEKIKLLEDFKPEHGSLRIYEP